VLLFLFCLTSRDPVERSIDGACGREVIAIEIDCNRLQMKCFAFSHLRYSRLDNAAS